MPCIYSHLDNKVLHKILSLRAQPEIFQTWRKELHTPKSAISAKTRVQIAQLPSPTCSKYRAVDRLLRSRPCWKSCFLSSIAGGTRWSAHRRGRPSQWPARDQPGSSRAIPGTRCKQGPCRRCSSALAPCTWVLGSWGRVPPSSGLVAGWCRRWLMTVLLSGIGARFIQEIWGTPLCGFQRSVGRSQTLPADCDVRASTPSNTCKWSSVSARMPRSTCLGFCVGFWCRLWHLPLAMASWISLLNYYYMCIQDLCIYWPEFDLFIRFNYFLSIKNGKHSQ